MKEVEGQVEGHGVRRRNRFLRVLLSVATGEDAEAGIDRRKLVRVENETWRRIACDAPFSLHHRVRILIHQVGLDEVAALRILHGDEDVVVGEQSVARSRLEEVGQLVPQRRRCRLLPSSHTPSGPRKAPAFARQSYTISREAERGVRVSQEAAAEREPHLCRDSVPFPGKATEALCVRQPSTASAAATAGARPRSSCLAA